VWLGFLGLGSFSDFSFFVSPVESESKQRKKRKYEGSWKTVKGSAIKFDDVGRFDNNFYTKNSWFKTL